MDKEVTGVFHGFTTEADRFLSDIRFNNYQQFYDENKERYEKYVKTPLRELSDEMTPVIQLIDPRLDTRPGRTMSRIRRDTRFTKDKSPSATMCGWAGATLARAAARALACTGVSGRTGLAGAAGAMAPISR